MEKVESQELFLLPALGRNALRTHFPQFSSGSAGLVLLCTLGSGKDAQALLQESSAPLGGK